MPQGFSRRQATLLSIVHDLDRSGKAVKMRAMSKDKEIPQLSPHGQAEAERRRKRQAEALRANLSRRKAQSRERAEGEPDTPAPGDGPSAEG